VAPLNGIIKFADLENPSFSTRISLAETCLLRNLIYVVTRTVILFC